jgi:protein gp37
MDRRHLERRQRLQRVSPGCTNCYAMRLAGTRLKHHPSRAGLTVDSKAGPVWNGEVRFNEAVLRQPLQMEAAAAHLRLRARRPVPRQRARRMIDQVFAVMALARSTSSRC